MQMVFSNKNSVVAHFTHSLQSLMGKMIVLLILLNTPASTFAANKIWSGATSTAWAVASNWVGNSLPGNGDNVLIPGGLINYPVASTNINIKIITINSSGTGGRLTITAGTFNPAAVTVNASGILTFNSGVMNATGLTVNGTFNMAGGTMESSDLLLINNGGVVNQSGGSIIMNGNAAANPNDNVKVNAGGVFNQAGGTLYLKDLLPGAGSIYQTGAGALIKVRRNWSFGTGSTFNATSGTIQFTGSSTASNFATGTRQFSNVIIDAAVNPGFSQVASSVIAINGNFTNNNTALTNTDNATFIFNGSGNQTISSATTGTGATLGTLEVNKSGGKISLLTNCNVSGNMTIISGTFDLAAFTCNRNVAGGSQIVYNTCSLLLGGISGGQAGSNFPLNFTTTSLAPNSTIHYNGANQTVAPFNYGNLTLSGNGGAIIKNFPGAALVVAGNFTTLAGTSTSVTCNAAASITITGNLSMGLNTILNGVSYSHNINSNFINNGTYNSAGITYLKGNLSGSGIYNGVTATLELNGVTLQTFSGNIFAGNILKNLTVNNSSGVLLTGNLKVTAIVKVIQGDFNSGGYLTLVSTATQTALIDGTGNGSVSGTVTMQRYIPSGFGYKYFSSPFQSATVNEFSDDLNLLAAFPPFYRYNESSAATGWVNYSAPSGVLQPLSGYAANFGNNTTAITADISGEVNSGPKSVTLFNTNQPFTTGFNLVGNPYPSPVNWDLVAGWNRVNIDNGIYYFDAGSADQYGGTYSSYINGISSNGSAGGLIPAMQGFFVHVSNGTFPVSGTLGINNAARTIDLQPLFHRSMQNDDRAVIRFDARFSGTISGADPVVVYFDDTATTGFDKERDALKIMNTDGETPSLYSLTPDNARLSINALPGSSRQKCIIPLGIRTKHDGNIIFGIKSIENIPDSIFVYLSDAEKRINMDLRTTPEYITALLAGKYENRFSLVLSTLELPYITDTDEFGVYSSGSEIFIYVNPADGKAGTVAITNMQGQILYKQVNISEGHYELSPGFQNGIYVVSFFTAKSSFSKKLFLKNE